MAKFCSKCGNPLVKDNRFCTKCGAAVSSNNAEKKSAENPKERTSAPKAEHGAFFDYIKSTTAQMLKLLKNPKALCKTILPSLIIALVWTVLAVLGMAFPKSAVIRVFSFFTYAQGGMFGGFFGALGGIVGKAIFAYLLSVVVNAIVNKRKIEFKAIFAGLKINGLSALACFLIGAGAAMVLYLAMNITSSAQNAIIGVVGAVMIVMAAGKKNGLIVMAVCALAKLLTRGKAPSQMTLSRVFSGMAAGFIIAVPLSLPRSAWICPIVCFVLLASGIAILIFRSKSRQAIAAMFAFAIALSSLMSTGVAVADSNAAPGEWVDPYTYWGLGEASRKEISKKMKESDLTATAFELKPICFYPHEYSDTDHYKVTDYTASSDAWVVELEKPAEDFKLTYSIERYVGEEKYLNDSYEVSIENLTLSLAENATYMYKYKADLTGAIKTYSETWHDQELYYKEICEGNINASADDAFVLEIQDGIVELSINAFSTGEHTEYHYESGETIETSECSGNSRIEFQVTRVLLGYIGGGGSSGWVVDNEMGGDDEVTDAGNEKNNETRKGVPLKDYDRDGDIDYTDRQIQYELIHDPDYLTRNGTAGAVMVAIMSILSAVFGGTASLVAGAVGAAAGTAGAAAAGSVGVASPYIKFDGVGDIEWTDPATGKMTQYIRQGDGKFKNPLTDQSYTYDELYENAAYRERNAEGFAQDAETAERNVEEQRKESGGLSDNAKEHAEVLRELEEMSEDREKMIDLANKYYLSPDMDKDELIKEITRKMDEERARGEKYAAQGDRMEIYEKSAQTVSAAADIGMDALATMTGPAGKVLNSAYKVGKGAAGKGAEQANYSDGDVTTGLMQGAFEGGIDAANDYLSGGLKAAGTVAGETVKGGLDSYIKGEDVADGMKDGAVKGALFATIDAGADAIGDGIKNATAAPKGIPIDESVFNAAKDTAVSVDVGTGVAGNIAKKVTENVLNDDN